MDQKKEERIIKWTLGIAGIGCGLTFLYVGATLFLDDVIDLGLRGVVNKKVIPYQTGMSEEDARVIVGRSGKQEHIPYIRWLQKNGASTDDILDIYRTGNEPNDDLIAIYKLLGAQNFNLYLKRGMKSEHREGIEKLVCNHNFLPSDIGSLYLREIIPSPEIADFYGKLKKHGWSPIPFNFLLGFGAKPEHEEGIIALHQQGWEWDSIICAYNRGIIPTPGLAKEYKDYKKHTKPNEYSSPSTFMDRLEKKQSEKNVPETEHVPL